MENVARRRQSMASEGLIGVASDRFADMAAKQQTGEKPVEILVLVIGRKVDAQLFRIEPALFQLGKIGHRRFFPVFSSEQSIIRLVLVNRAIRVRMALNEAEAFDLKGAGTEIGVFGQKRSEAAGSLQMRQFDRRDMGPGLARQSDLLEPFSILSCKHVSAGFFSTPTHSVCPPKNGRRPRATAENLILRSRPTPKSNLFPYTTLFR